MNRHVEPCPFCGNDGTRDPRHVFHWDDGEGAVQCGQCGALGPWVLLARGSAHEAEEAALKKWNERAVLAHGRPSETGASIEGNSTLQLTDVGIYDSRTPRRVSVVADSITQRRKRR